MVLEEELDQGLCRPGYRRRVSRKHAGCNGLPRMMVWPPCPRLLAAHALAFTASKATISGLKPQKKRPALDGIAPRNKQKRCVLPEARDPTKLPMPVTALMMMGVILWPITHS